MAKVLVLYYSSWGHVEQMARAVAEGAREAGAEVAVKRVPELVPEEVARQFHYKLDQEAPIATVEELAEYDAIIFGTPTRYGNMASQMKQFIDQTGGLWAKGALVGKVGSAFTSTASQHGGIRRMDRSAGATCAADSRDASAARRGEPRRSGNLPCGNGAFRVRIGMC